MGTARRITVNTALLSVGEIFSKAIQFMLMVLAARILGADDFGKFSFGLSIAMIAIILFDMGIYTMLVREIARKKEQTSIYIVNSIVLKAIIAVIVTTAIILFLELFDYPPDSKRIAYIMTGFALLSSYTEIFYSVFRAHERMGFDALLKMIRMAALFTLGYHALSNGLGVMAFGTAFVASELLVVLIAVMIESKYFAKLSFAIDPKKIKEIFHKAWPFGVAFAFGSIYFYVDSVILLKLRGEAEVGIYGAAYNLAIALLFIPTVYTSAIYPVMSRYFSEDNSNLALIYEKSIKYLYMIGLPISLGLYYLAERIINLFFGSEYAMSSLALKIISGFVVLKFVNYVFGITLSAIDQQSSRMKSMMWTAIFNVTLNLALIPSFGFIGAAIATIATEIFLFMIYYGAARQFMGKVRLLETAWKPALAGIAMILYMHFATALTLWLLVLSCGAIYFGVLLALGAFDREDRRLIEAIRKNG